MPIIIIISFIRLKLLDISYFMFSLRYRTVESAVSAVPAACCWLQCLFLVPCTRGCLSIVVVRRRPGSSFLCIDLLLAVGHNGIRISCFFE